MNANHNKASLLDQQHQASIDQVGWVWKFLRFNLLVIVKRARRLYGLLIGACAIACRRRRQRAAAAS